MLADMSKKGLFTYAGRTNQGDAKFSSGECAMFSGSTGAQAGIRKAAKFDWSINFIPYHDDVKGAPQNSIIGGASVWVMGGKKPDEYKGVAKFLAFLSQPEIQMEWHTDDRLRADHAGGLRDDEASPASTTRIRAPSSRSSSSPTSRRPRTPRACASATSCRGATVIEEELENVFSGKKEAKTALDDAVKRGNEILRQFEAANK